MCFSKSIFGTSRCAWRFFLADPLRPLALVPHPIPLFAILYVYSATVLLALFPAADVLATVGPFESAFAVFLVVLIAAFVSSAIGPGASSIAMHLILDPLSIINSAISPLIFAASFDIVFGKFTIVGGAVGP